MRMKSSAFAIVAFTIISISVNECLPLLKWSPEREAHLKAYAAAKGKNIVDLLAEINIEWEAVTWLKPGMPTPEEEEKFKKDAIDKRPVVELLPGERHADASLSIWTDEEQAKLKKYAKAAKKDFDIMMAQIDVKWAESALPKEEFKKQELDYRRREAMNEVMRGARSVLDHMTQDTPPRRHKH